MQRDRRSFQLFKKLLRRRNRRIERRQAAVRSFERMEPRLMLAADTQLELPLGAPGELEGPHAEHALAAEGEGGALLGEGESSNPTSLGEFAQALAEEGVRFFGAFWCPHCNRQKELFGDDENLLPFIEVTEGDPAVLGSVVLNAVGRGEDLTLNPTGRAVNSFPTWEFQDGTRLEGFQTLATLSQFSGIPLPPDVISIQTNAGRMEWQLLTGEAPLTVDNFLNYVNPRAGETQGRLVGTVFHRAAESGAAEFVLQGGGFAPTKLTYTPEELTNEALAQIQNNPIPTDPPIQDERDDVNGIANRENLPGTVAMAKNALGATSQSFTNANDNRFLDAQGFTVFAVDVDFLNPDGTFNTDATANRISALRDVNLQPGSTVFENVPFIDNVDGEGEIVSSDMVVIQAIDGSGLVSGLAFDDLDRDGVLDANEAGRGGIIVFSDANGNGVADDDEFSAMTAADGTYELVLPAGEHTVRQQAVAGLLQTTPTNPESFTLNVEIGRTISDVRFGVFEVGAPNVVDLAAATDSGNSADNVTNFNNSDAGTALQFDVSGLVDGATVRLFADGVQIGEGTASGSSVTITTDGSTSLADGARSIIATQEVDGLQGPASAALSVTIDTTSPGAFTTTAPTTVIIGQDISYDANVTDEGGDVTYSLTNAPAGATINASTGVVSWTPQANQLGSNPFNIVAADTAGNTRTQVLNVDVIEQPIVGATFKITADDDPLSDAISQVNVGDDFYLHVSVADLRDDPDGIFAFFEDVDYDPLLASADPNIIYYTNFPQTRSGEVATEQQNGANVETGVVDEVGAGRLQSVGLGAGFFDIFSVKFAALRSGTLNLVGNEAENLPANHILVLGSNDPVPLDQVVFGSAQLAISPSFGANDDIRNFNEDTTDNVISVLDNDSSLSGSTENLTVARVIPAAGQTEIIGNARVSEDNKNVLYTPPADFNGEVTFTYVLTDGLDELQANVLVTISPVNDRPTAVDDTFDGETSVDEDTVDNFLDVLSNDLIAPDTNETLTVTAVGSGSNGGTLEIGPARNHVLYTPAANFSGTETFTYTISDRGDGTGLTHQGMITITVNPVNDAPIPGNDSFAVEEDSQDNELDVLANDTDPEGDAPLTILSAGNTNAGGTVTVNQAGTLVLYTPAADHFGDETFTYVVSDGKGGESTGRVTVTSNNTNDAPTAVADTFTITENTSNNTVDVLANDSNDPDPPGQTLTIDSIDTTGTQGTATIAADNLSVLYTPPADFLGTDSFSYVLSDGSPLMSTTSATINVVEFVPGSLSGFVFIDTNNDGIRDPGEEPFEGVTISLTGTDDFNRPVSLQTTTDATGAYSFNDLAPGTYMLGETQPTGEIDGVPIVDGKDTIGSQGGTVSANDEFTITLPEGTHGTNNNFAELLGRSIRGEVVGGGNAMFGNLNFEVFERDDSGARIEPAVRTVQAVGGSVSIDGLPAGDYEVVPAQHVFLIAPETGSTATIATDDSTGNQFRVPGRRAEHLSLRDISNAAAEAADSGEFIQAAIDAAGNGWYSLGSHYSDRFTEGQFTLTEGGTMVHIELTATGGERQMTDISLDDPRLRQISQEGDFLLIEITVPSDQLGLQEATPAAEGEAPVTEIVPLAITAEGEGSAISSATATTSDLVVNELPMIQPVLGQPGPIDFGNSVASVSSTQLSSSNDLPLALISTANTSPTAAVTLGTNTATSEEPRELVGTQQRGALLDEIANEYADEHLYGSSSNASMLQADIDLDEDAVDQAMEDLDENELLDLLALGAIV